jgi:hypothetical protein
VLELVASLTDFRVRRQHSVHRANRARRRLANVQQLSADLRRRQIDEAFLMQQG